MALLVLSDGSYVLCSGGGSFSERKGGVMIEFDVEMVRISAVRALSLAVAIRRLAKPLGLDGPDLEAMEREFRAAAAEVQRVEKATRG